MAGEFQSILDNSLRFWERGRIAYNAVLLAIVALWVILSWPHFRPALNARIIAVTFVLAVLANVCFCAAYLVDIPLQYSSWQRHWRRWRWILWLIGTLFAGIIANYWIADEIYSFV